MFHAVMSLSILWSFGASTMTMVACYVSGYEASSRCISMKVLALLQIKFTNTFSVADDI